MRFPNPIWPAVRTAERQLGVGAFAVGCDILSVDIRERGEGPHGFWIDERMTCVMECSLPVRRCRGLLWFHLSVTQSDRRLDRVLGCPWPSRGWCGQFVLAVWMLLNCVFGLSSRSRGETYLPLDAGTTWAYSGLAGENETVLVAGLMAWWGVETSVLEYHDSTQNEGLASYYTTDSDGSVMIWGFFRSVEGFGYLYYPPITLVAPPLHVGMTWSSEFDLYALPGTTYVGHYRAGFEVYQDGVVTVPAGTYEAFGIGLPDVGPDLPSGFESVSFDGVVRDARSRRPDASTDWWTDGIGRVQYITSDTYQLSSFESPTPLMPLSWGRLRLLYR